MKRPVFALTLLATTTAYAGDGRSDDAIETAHQEAVQTAQEIEAAKTEARTEVVAARAQMEAARKELQAAAKRMAEVSRAQLVSSKPRAFLGVLIGEQSEDGIVVAGVTPAGGAEAAGIEADDTIVAIDGKSLTGHDQPLEVLYDVLDEVEPGGDVTLAISRDGEIVIHDVATAPGVFRIQADGSGALPGLGHVIEELHYRSPQTTSIAQARSWLDLVGGRGPTGQPHLVDIGEDLGDYFGVDGGVLVLNAPGRSELKPGDIVRRIDGADVASAAEARRLLAATPDEDAEVEVRRRNRKVEVTVAKESVAVDPLIRAMPHGEATITIVRPEIEVDVEVKDQDQAE